MDKIFRKSKSVQGWNRKDNKKKVYVRQFTESKVNCTRDYIKLCIRENDLVYLMFHIITNKAPSIEKAKSIAESILSLAKEAKTINLDDSIWNNKVMEVNSYLTLFSMGARRRFLPVFPV